MTNVCRFLTIVASYDMAHNVIHLQSCPHYSISMCVYNWTWNMNPYSTQNPKYDKNCIREISEWSLRTVFWILSTTWTKSDFLFVDIFNRWKPICFLFFLLTRNTCLMKRWEITVLNIAIEINLLLSSEWCKYINYFGER